MEDKYSKELLQKARTIIEETTRRI